ncbi:DEAD/DEAH box helicase [Yimella sp. cx-573]|nr:DEAD/DEAH box helicase [Yimella sp. cx-573]
MQPKKNAGKKARWTRTQKNEVKRGEVRRPTSERGRPARGGASRFDNDNRGERRSFDRRDDNRSFERRDDNRGERGGYQGRRDDNRGGYQGRRDDRAGYQGRRDDRAGYEGRRDDSRGFERRDDNRGGYQGRRDDRPAGERSEFRGQRRWDRDDNRGGYQGRRDDNRGFDRRDGNRGGYQGRRDDNRGLERRDDNRGGYQGRRDDRPAGERNDFRGQRRWDRDDNRGGYQGRRDETRSERSGYQGRRDDRRSFDRNDRQGRQNRGYDSRPPRFEAPADRAPDRLEDDLEPTNEAFGWVERQETDDVVTAEPIELGENGFAALGLPDLLVARLARDGITQPFPIQQASIPDALEGRDVLGRGRTGSGKTLAFGLPLLTRLAKGGKARAHQPRSIIMVPTRELAMQVSDALQPLVHVIGLRHKLVAGGMPYEPQLQALERGVDVLVATPGRLKDLIDRGAADLSRVEVTVLDEADHMAEMGFLEAIEEILDLVPADGQRLLFSATLDRGIDGVVEKYLSDPAEHSTDDGTATVTTMAHHALLIEPRDKKIVTAEVANRPGRTVVFARTKLGADRVAGELRECGVLAAALHGGLNQSQRNRALSAFRDGRLPVLVATDVAARGIHVDDVGVVLQIDPPADHKDYLHRSGRTARAGEQGVVVSLVLPHQRRTVQRLLEQAGVDTELQKTRPGDEVIAATGGSTPEGNPISDDDLQQVLNPGRGRGRGGGGGRRGGYRDDRGGGYGRRSSGHGGGYGGGRGQGRGQRSDRRSY